MLELEEAQARILAVVPLLPVETVPLAEAGGRVVAEPVLSPLDLPLFDNSAMDGYAVRAKDVQGAGSESPVRLRLSGQAAAGATWQREVEPGTCVRVFTGSALPPGADAVVMQEDTRVEADKPVEVLVCDAVRPWENVRLRGEDVKRGATLLEAGEIIGAGGIALLGAVGAQGVKVRRRPRVAVVGTGSELVEPGQALEPGKIYESNRLTLATLLGRAGAAPRVLELVPDSLPATREALRQAFVECDAVVSSGGVSVGEFDLVKRAFEELGGRLEFWRVAIKPGKPFVFGRWEGKFLFGLPGNPVSAVVTFLLLVRPALLRWQGAREVGLPAHPGVLEEPLVNRGERRHFVRVKVEANGAVRSAGVQGSHLLSSLAASNGLVAVAPETTLPAGASVQVWRWDL